MRLIDADAFDERVRVAGGMVEEELTDDFKDGVLATLELLKTQPTVNQWIPCSERLPEEYDELLVTYKEDEQIKPLIEIMEYEPHYDYYNGEWIGKWVYEDITDVNVIAWMPLPKPYKEGGQ